MVSVGYTRWLELALLTFLDKYRSSISTYYTCALKIASFTEPTLIEEYLSTGNSIIIEG